MSQDSELPEAWSAFLSSLTLLAKGRSSDVSPFHCERDELCVMSDPAHFSSEEFDRLRRWGFVADFDKKCFFSFGMVVRDVQPEV